MSKKSNLSSVKCFLSRSRLNNERFERVSDESQQKSFQFVSGGLTEIIFANEQNVKIKNDEMNKSRREWRVDGTG